MQHRHSLDQLLALARLDHHLGVLLQGFGQLSRAPPSLEQSLDGHKCPLMVGLASDGFAPRLDGQIGCRQALFENLGLACVQIGAQVGKQGCLDALVQDGHQPLPAVGSGGQTVQLGQRRNVSHVLEPGSSQSVQCLSATAELGLGSSFLAQGSHPARRILDALQPNLENIGQLAQVAHSAVGRLQQLGHARPQFRLPQHSLQRRDRIGMAGGSPEHLAVQIHRARGATKAFAFHLGQLKGNGIFGCGILCPPQHPD